MEGSREGHRDKQLLEGSILDSKWREDEFIERNIKP